MNRQEEHDPNEEHWNRNRDYYFKKYFGRNYFLISSEKLVAATSTEEPLKQMIEREKYDNYLVIHIKKHKPI